MNNFKRPLFASLIFISFSACAPRATSDHDGLAAGIVGGDEVLAGNPIGQSIVYIDNVNSRGDCTGVLIGENLVLTAAHCVDEDLDSMQVIFTNRKDNRKAPHLPIIKILKHEMFQLPGGDRNDIALLRFQGQRPVGTAIASLPEERVFSGTEFTALGYGTTTGRRNRDLIGSDDFGVLRVTKVTINSTRPNGLEFNVDQSQGHGVCYGDSGGPALILKGTSQVVVGLATGVYSPAGSPINEMDYDFCKAMSLYTDVFGYREWILENSRTILAL